jgi:PAS domain S-box-containing protein
MSLTDSEFGQILVEDSADAVAGVTLDGTIIFWNLAAREMFGYSREEALGRSIDSLIAPADLQGETARAMNRAIETGLTSYESVRKRKDGSLLAVSISEKLATDERGQRFIAVSAKDITSLKALRDSRMIETRFNGLLESVPDAMAIVNGEGRIVLVNARAENLFGYPREELQGRSIEVLMPERSNAGQASFRAGYFREPRMRSIRAGLELYGVRRDGTEFPVEISLSPLETDDGVFAISAIRDITDRRTAEAKFRGLLESAPDAMIIVNQQGAIMLINAQAEKLFGYQRNDLLGKPIQVLIPGNFKPGHREFWEGYFKDPRTRSMGTGSDLYARRRDGTSFPAEINLSPLETREGKLVTAAVRDITEQRKVQEEISRKNLELEEQNSRVEQANRLKSEFLANMSHELRTPLNSIIGFSEFLVDQKPGPLNPKQREYLGDILNSGRHLLRLINDILDLSKVESGKMELSIETFGVDQAVAEVCAIIAPTARKKGISVETDLTPVGIGVTLDQQRFKQILYNLLSNAVKFTADGGTVQLLTNRHGGGEFKIQVKDTGIGIKSEDVPKLFTEFTQLDSSAGRRYEGTGLGLALTKKIVELQGGRIWVDSEFGLGTTFVVVLPMAAGR